MRVILIFGLLFFLLSCEQRLQVDQEIIGFIDPDNSYYARDFNTCSDTILYNYLSRSTRWEKRAAYYGGSKAIRKVLNLNYNPVNFNESGYLTYRFVLNCYGESGRFVIEEADLNFESTNFSEPLKSELLEITKDLKDWRPLCFKGENVDSYMYITYKLKEGKIIEILP